MKHLFSAIAALFSRRGRACQTPPISRQFQLGIEILEGRSLPSVSPIHTLVAPTPMMTQTTLVQPLGPSVAPQALNLAGQGYQIYHPVDVPDLQGFSFHLISSSGKPAHDLAIQTQTYNADGSASFTGTWTGDNNPSGGKVNVIMNGTLKFDANGNMILSFSWMNGQGSQNSFTGTLTRVTTGPAGIETVYGIRYLLEGDVTTPTPGGGPGHVTGTGSLPFPALEEANF